MMSAKEFFYFQLPVKLQNLFVSFYGHQLSKKRYGEPFAEIFRKIEAMDVLSTDELEALKLARLKEVLSYAAEEIPYYTNLFRNIGICAADIKELTDLEKIPPLEKEALRNSPSDFFPRDVKRRSYFLQKTSGSTGKPLSVHVDENTYKTAMALLVHHEKLHGVSVGDARATFAGRMVQRIDDNSPPFCRYNKAENQLIFSAYHVNEQNFSAYKHELNRFKPQEIIGYPSAIYSMAYQFKVSGQSLNFRPRLIVTNSETLLTWQRELIEDVFRCRIYDYYGTAEYVVFAGQCKQFNYHISPALGILEVTDPTGAGMTGVEGDILCTTLSNYAMPLIRYRIGDRGLLSGERCACGSNLETLKSVEGRVDDVVITADNRKIGRLDHIYKGLSGIKEAQIVQKKNDLCLIRIVKSDRQGSIDGALLTENLRSRVGSNMKIEIHYVNEIEKSETGKFKAVVNQMTQQT